jgi:hypothetical protein
MRFNLRLIFLALFILFFVLALAGGLLWANLNFVRSLPGGADFYVLWKGGQNFLLQGQVPYQDLTRQIQNLVYGHPARPGELLPRLNIPLYLLPIFSPFVLIRDASLARAIWMVFLEIGLFSLVLLVIQLTHWKPGRFYVIFLMLFGVFWAPAAISLFSGNAIIFQAAVLFCAIRALEFEADELAGALIALAWFNLEVVGLLGVLLLYWVWSINRLRVWGGFLMATILLAGISILFNVTWVFPFLGALVANWNSNPNLSTFSLLEAWLPGVGLRLAQGLTLAIALMLIAEWRAVRGKDLHWLLWTASLTIAATPLLGLPFAPGSLVLSLPVMLLLLSIMEQRWGRFGRWSAVVFFTVVFWGLWAALWGRVGSVFVLFFPAMLVVLLYWVRWWAIRPPRLWADMISDVGKSHDAP